MLTIRPPAVPHIAYGEQGYPPAMLKMANIPFISHSPEVCHTLLQGYCPRRLMCAARQDLRKHLNIQLKALQVE